MRLRLTLSPHATITNGATIMNRLGTAFVLALLVMARSKSGDGDMAAADESLSLWVASASPRYACSDIPGASAQDINAAVESAQGADCTRRKEADAESKAYKTKRWRYLALFEEYPEGRDSSLAPLGKPPDAERESSPRGRSSLPQLVCTVRCSTSCSNRHTSPSQRVDSIRPNPLP